MSTRSECSTPDPSERKNLSDSALDALADQVDFCSEMIELDKETNATNTAKHTATLFHLNTCEMVIMLGRLPHSENCQNQIKLLLEGDKEAMLMLLGRESF